MDHLENPILIEGTVMIIYVFEFGIAMQGAAANILSKCRLLILVLVNDREFGLTLLAVGVAALVVFHKERRRVTGTIFALVSISRQFRIFGIRLFLI